MSNPLEMLEIVDENDNIIGLETREKVHKDGLLHREIHVFFLTPKGEIIFQHRAKDKDTYPDKLTATVSGHVEPNMTYEETAIKECFEETGIELKPVELNFFGKIRKESFDEITKTKNNIFSNHYIVIYRGSISNLLIEEGKAQGFESWLVDDLLKISYEDKRKFIDYNINKEVLDIFIKAKETLLK